MKRLILSGLITVALVAGTWRVGRAQEPSTAANPPNISGSWAVDTSAEGQPLFVAGRPVQPSFGTRFVAWQDRRTLFVGRIIADEPDVTIYRFDAPESLNFEGGAEKTVSSAAWQDRTLTIQTRVADAPGTLPRNKLVRVISLDAKGRLLVQTTNGLDSTYLTVYRRVAM